MMQTWLEVDSVGWKAWQPRTRQKPQHPPHPTSEGSQGGDPPLQQTLQPIVHVSNATNLPTVGEPGGEAVLVDVADGARALAGGEQEQGRASLPVFPRAAHAARGLFLLLPTVITRSVEKERRKYWLGGCV